MKILLLVPGLYDRKGGIQAFSVFLFEALKAEHSVTIVSKHDRRVGIDLNQGTFCGSWPRFLRTAAFSFAALWGSFYHRPDLIIATHIHFSPLFHFFRRIGRAKCWAVAHGVDAWEIRSRRVREGVSSADKILAVSHITESRMITQGYIQGEKCEVLYNRADESRFDINCPSEVLRARLQISEDTKILLMVCRLDASEKYKGYDQVLEALVALGRNDIVFVLVGDGDDRERIEALVHQYGLKDSVRMVGVAPDNELPGYYALADLFIMPSRGEGFGIVFLEAMFSGTPCVGGKSDGAAEALQQGSLGILVDPTNIDEISKAICDGLRTPFRGEELRRAALAVFGRERFEIRIRELLREVS